MYYKINNLILIINKELKSKRLLIIYKWIWKKNRYIKNTMQLTF